MQLIHAVPSQSEEILSLYRSAIGHPFCVWSEEYPGPQEIEMDLANNGLYLLTEGDALLGAISVEPGDELIHEPCWQVLEGSVEISRVVIALPYRGRGLARVMVSLLMEELKRQGVPAIHLAVVDENIPARRTYQSLGFSFVGEDDLWGHHYSLCEKIL